MNYRNDEINNVKFRKAITNYLDANEKSMAELSQEIGRSKSYISGYLKGKSINKSTFEFIAKYIGVNPIDYITFTIQSDKSDKIVELPVFANLCDLTTYELLDLIQKYCSYHEQFCDDEGIQYILNNLLLKELEYRGLWKGE